VLLRWSLAKTTSALLSSRSTFKSGLSQKQDSVASGLPQSVFLNPDATLAWVSYPFENFVEVIDVMTGIVNSSIQVQQPIDVVFNATGTTAYISSRLPGSVVVVDTKTYSTIANIPTAAGSSDLLLSPSGGILTVGNFDSASISAIENINAHAFPDDSGRRPGNRGVLTPDPVAAA
jgi:YVTN family beta-propeller protein